MGAFKGLETDTAALHAETLSDARPLFEPFDLRAEGGLVVDADGYVHELRHPYWGNEEDAIADRAIKLPIRAEWDEAGEVRLTWEGQPFNPARPSTGVESEVSVMHQTAWFPVSPDGRVVAYPDGTTEPLADLGLDPEALDIMVEGKNQQITYGTEELRRETIRSAARLDRWLEQHDLTTPALSLHPDAFTQGQINKLPYVQKTTDAMPQIAEFGTMSNQLHVQMLSPEAAQHAMNAYQRVQAVFGLVTAAAPARDGSFDTTIGEHYRFGDLPEKQAGELLDPTLPAHDFAALLQHVRPHDWRELARVIGSPSAGALPEAAPVSLKTLLQLGDHRLRDGSVVTLGRALGWHADRLRLDKGTIEVCNLGTAGGNLRKASAVQEVVTKYLTAEQLRYAIMTSEQRDAQRDTYQHDITMGHHNNVNAALWGRKAKLYSFDGQLVTPQQMLRDVLAFTDRYSPEPVSQTAREELEAIFAETPAYETPEEVFAAFFRPNSTMTATDALRYAHELAPEVASNDMFGRFAAYRRAQVYDLEAELQAQEEQEELEGLVAAGTGALALSN